MKTTSLHCYDCPKGLHVVVFLVAMLSISSHSADAMTADLVPQDSRVSVAADNIKNAWRYAVAYQLRPPRRLRARHLELALGAIATTSQTHAFVSFGPGWQLPLARGNDRWHVQLGFSPTRRVLSCASGAGTVSASARMEGGLSQPRTCIW